MIKLTTQITDVEISMEALVCLGATPALLAPGGPQRLPQLCAGHLILLDLLGSPLLVDPRSLDVEPTRGDVATALAVMVSGPKAIYPIFLYAAGKPDEWQKLVTKAAKLITEDNFEAVGNQVMAIVDVGRGGFEMIQDTGKGGGSGRMDAAWLAAIFAGCDGLLTLQDILWHTPFAFVGHIIAQRVAAMGGEVRRPIDIAAAMEQLNAQLEAS